MRERKFRNLKNERNRRDVRFQVLAAANIQMTVFWDIASCGVIEVDRRFRGVYCLHHQGYSDDGGISQKAIVFS
jgi:hypothetical protein